MPSTPPFHPPASTPVTVIESVELSEPKARGTSSRDLEWEDPVTGERLGLRIRASAGLLRRLLEGGFEEAESPPGGIIPPGPGVAA